MIKEKPMVVCRLGQTPEIPVVVLMETIHREIMVKLQETGVTLFKNYKADIIMDLNRMVLGGKRLHEVCETLNHLQCEYFLNSGISL